MNLWSWKIERMLEKRVARFKKLAKNMKLQKISEFKCAQLQLKLTFIRRDVNFKDDKNMIL